MLRFPVRCRPVSLLLYLAIPAISLVIAPMLNAAPLTGDVTNKTSNKPSTGDTVVLFNLTQGMQEGGRTKTDVRGRFTLDAGEGPHLIRVDHQKASYFHEAPPGTTSVAIDVYDVLEKVPGVSTDADVIRVEADQQGLHVIENYFVKNDSSPPKTQFSDHAFEIALPPDAQIEASAARAPQGMPVSSSPTPLTGKGHYAFVFPLRPGETRFQLSYRIPYTGSYKFTPHVYMPTGTLAIMLPKAMRFLPGQTSLFQSADEDVNAQTFIAKNVAAGEALAFTVSGTGSMPREDQASPAQAGQNGAAAGGPAGDATAQGAPTSASTDTRPGGGLGAPLETPDPLTKYRLWILGSLLLLLAAAAAFLLRRAPLPAVAAPSSASATSTAHSYPSGAREPLNNGIGPQNSTLAALKEELFTLETERIAGTVSEAEYAQTKSALEVVLRRALARRAS